MPAETVAPPSAATIGATLRRFRFGHDPTTMTSASQFCRSTLTPDGPGTLLIRVSADGRLDVESWGPGGTWLAARAAEMCGLDDAPEVIVARHPAVAVAQRRHRDLRLGASRTLYHELLVTILGQRITAGEAAAQWRRLCWHLGSPAPGPDSRLRLPPDPQALRRTPTWQLHTLGIERQRAEALRVVAAHAEHLWEWAWLPPLDCAMRLQQLKGVGQWTIGTVLGTALGDPDAVAVGDYHLRNIVAYALAGRPRGTDEEMLEELAVYAGQRGRIVALLVADGWRAPKFGPRQPIVSIANL